VFALCIIRRPCDGKFLMTQEYAGQSLRVTRFGSHWLMCSHLRRTFPLEHISSLAPYYSVIQI
jgi:hypothetical protein